MIVQVQNVCRCYGDQYSFIEMYNTKISREEFINSRFLTIKVVDIEKSLLHRNVLKAKCRDLYFKSSQIERLIFLRKRMENWKGSSTKYIVNKQITTKMGMLEFVVQHHLRTKEKYKALEDLFKKINSGYLMVAEGSSEVQISKKNMLRNAFYNLFYSSIEQQASEDDEPEQKQSSIKRADSMNSSFVKDQKQKNKDRKVSEDIKMIKDDTVTKANQTNPSLNVSADEKINIQIKVQSKKGNDLAEKKSIDQKGKGEKQNNMSNDKQDKKDDRKQREKTDGYFTKLKNLYRSKAGQGEDRKSSLLKGIESLWLRQGDNWYQKSFSITENMLILCDKEGLFKHIFMLKKLEVTISDVPYRRILLSHPLLSRSIELRVRGEGEDTLQDSLRVLELLKEGNGNRCQEMVCNFVGMRISNRKNKFSQQQQKRPARDLLVKITHEGESVSFLLPIDGNAFLQLPVTNNYGTIECEVAEERETGLIPTFREYRIGFNIPVQSVYDQLFNEKPKRKNPEARFFILQSKQCNYSLKLDWSECASWRSYCTIRWEDRFEGERPPQEFTRSQFRIQKNRMKRIIYSVEGYVGQLKALKNMQDPLQSYLFYTILVLAVFLFDANFLIHYLLALLAGLLLYCHPSSASWGREIAAWLGANDWVRLLWQQRSIRSGCRYKVSFKKQQEKRAFLQQFKFTSKKDRNIVQKYQRLHEVLLKGQLVLTEGVTICEKIKNIFCWYHHQKTSKLLLLLIVALTVIIFVPIRLILLFAIYRSFKKGLSYRARTKQLNRIVLLAVFRVVGEEIGNTELRSWLNDPTRPVERRGSEWSGFEKRVREWLLMNLGLEYESDMFLQSRSINEVIGHLCDCGRRLVLPQSICRKYKFNLQWSVAMSGLTRVLLLVYGFIINTPSDRNILGIHYEEPDKNDLENQSEEDN